MKLLVAQIYIEPGVTYPFSHHFQLWLGQELTNRVQPSQAFLQVYPEDFDLIFRVSARSKITEPEIKGPTVFKPDKDVEFTIFLPHDGPEPNEPSSFKRALEMLLKSVAVVLQPLDWTHQG